MLTNVNPIRGIYFKVLFCVKLAIERGEKLSELEEKTERMKLEAEAYSGTSHQLKMKYKDKKWYQF